MLDPPFRLRLVSSLTVDAVNGMGGWANRQAASQPQQPTSASAGRPCENPCVRECRCLSQAGMGSAMEAACGLTGGCDRGGERLSVSVNKAWGVKCSDMMQLHYLYFRNSPFVPRLHRHRPSYVIKFISSNLKRGSAGIAEFGPIMGKIQIYLSHRNKTDFI